jgi:hypothetical protein
MWVLAGFSLAILFDFTRRATDGGKCKQVHGVPFLWIVSFAIYLVVMLVAGVMVMIVGGAETLINVLKVDTGAVLVATFLFLATNSITYGVRVDLNS